MGPLDRLPHLHPSLSLPSLSHRKSTSRVHHHLKSPRARRRPSSTLIAPLLEHPSPSRICSLCQQGIPVGIIPYHFPKTAPAAIAALNPYIQSSASPHAFCYACWVWIHNLSLCWTCGDTVSRHEGRVSFGWCWWHWACVSCLFCRTPLPPPSWTAKPSGIILETPPACKCCAEDLTLLEDFPQSPPSPPALPPSSLALLDTMPGNLAPIRYHPSRSWARPLPKWMAQLPSNRISKRTFSRSSSCVPNRSAAAAAAATIRPSSRLQDCSSPALTRSSPPAAQTWISRYRGRAPLYTQELSAVLARHGGEKQEVAQ